MPLPTPESLEFEKRDVMTDAAQCWQAVSANGLDLQWAAESLKTEVLCRIACRQTGEALAFVPAALKTRELCLLAARQGTQVHFVPWHLLDEELTRVLIRHNGSAFSSLPKRWQTDITVAAAMNSGQIDSIELILQTPQAALLAIEEDMDACANVPAHLFTPEVFAKAESLYGTQERWPSLVARHKPQVLIGETQPTLGSETFKQVWACFLTPSMCIAALQAGDALYRLPRHLLTREVSDAAFALDTYNLTWIPPAHITRRMCELALQTSYGRLLSVVPEHLLTPELCVTAVESNEAALEFVPKGQRTMSLYITAVKSHPKALAHVPTALRYDVLTQLIAQDPTNALDYRRRRAAVAAAQRNFELAIADCDALLQMQPTLTEAYFLRANARHDLGQWRAAFHDIQTVIALEDDYPWANNLQGLLYQCAGCPGDLAAAIAAFSREIKHHPTSVRPLISRAELAMKQNNGRHATADLEAALKLEPNNARALYLRGYLAHETGDLEAALADQTAYAQALREASCPERLSDKPAGKPFTQYPLYAEFKPAANACIATNPDDLGAPRTAQHWREAVTARPTLIKLLPREWRSAELYAFAVERDPSLVMQVPAVLMTPHFYAVALRIGRITFEKVPQRQLSEAACIAAVQTQRLPLEHIPDTWRTLNVCIAAYTTSPGSINHVPDALIGQVYKAVGKNWVERALDAALYSGRGLHHWGRAFEVIKMFAPSSWNRKRP